MTTAEVTRTVASHEAQELRRRVHLLLEGEYLRLRAADRPELLMSAGGVADGLDPDAIAGEMDVVNRRIETLERHFAASTSDPFDPVLGRVFLLDLGDGPQLMLVSAVDVADDQVIAADSPLGRALQDVVPGQVVTYQCPRERRQARVLAVEAEAARARTEWCPPTAEALVGFDAREGLSSAARANVVLPPRPEPKPYGRVVVGLRDSHQCADALAVGFAEADRRGADLLVILIRDRGADHVTGDNLEPVFHAPDEVDAQEAAHLPLAVAAARLAFPEVRVTTVLRTGHFAEVLVELSHAADLVVLGMGERPTGMGRKDLLIASHSTCPVIVVRESPIRGGI